MQEYREELFRRLDVLAIFERYAGALRRLNDREYRFLCPFHDDQDPSANVNVTTTAWFCHACGAKGSIIDLVMRREGKEYKEVLELLALEAGMEPYSISRRPSNGQAGPAKPARSTSGTRALSEENVRAWHEIALRNDELMTWFREHRGFTDETVRAWLLGWDGSRVTIPVRDESGALVNVRRYLRDSKGTAGKMLSLAAGTGGARLMPMAALEEAEVLLVEGEWDMMLARQYGLNAMTVTSGAGIFMLEWLPLFAGKSVTICYDNDDAGRDGAAKVAKMLLMDPKITVSIATIPDLPPKGDITDFFVEQQRTVSELRLILQDAAPQLVAPLAERGEARRTPLYEASSAAFQGVYLATPVVVSGKSMTPFTVPYDVTAACDMSNKRLCPICPLKQVHNGTNSIRLDASDKRVLSLVDVPISTQEKALKEMAGAVPSCPRPRLTVNASVNVEELRVIPEIDTKPTAGESEHVSRTAYFLGHGTRSSRSYTGLGYVHPHPKTQATVHLLSELVPAMDNISAFTVTPETNELLRAFEGPVAERFEDIYDDFRLNVHRIQGRLDMQIAYDLVWHSVIGFRFNGAEVRRGWTECMVMGDSGQGKTEMALELLAHYGIGDRIQGEQASQAGLIGGLEKMGDTWILGWGKLALNDKRLLIVDETQGLDEGQIEAMSDVRATGVAEITKIRTEKTNARCRLIWLANPPDGRPLAHQNQGVIAIQLLFKKPEDIRRLDFAITVASGDVSLAEVNRAHGEPRPPRYTREACRALILWAWSRSIGDIVFTPEATDAILAAAIEMGGYYSAHIPLVEPADQRLKLARLSVAAAARVHSTDPTGEQIIVTPEHVAFVVDYLGRIYRQPSMAYDEYSTQVKQGEALTTAERDVVVTELARWLNADDALSFFGAAKVFKKSELIDVVGWDEAYAKLQLRFLANHKLIRPTREGYVKTPVYNGLLRQLRTGVLALELPSEDDAPF